MDYYSELGKNIRALRKTRGMKLQDLSDAIYEKCDVEVSANLISMWERGERRISVEQLGHICVGLGCTPNRLCPMYNSPAPDTLMQEFAALSDNEKEILEYATIGWDGNVHALIQFIALYVSLPRSIRHEIAAMGLLMYERGRKTNLIKEDAPQVDVNYINEQWHALLGKE